MYEYGQAAPIFVQAQTKGAKNYGNTPYHRSSRQGRRG